MGENENNEESRGGCRSLNIRSRKRRKKCVIKEIGIESMRIRGSAKFEGHRLEILDITLPGLSETRYRRAVHH